MKVEHPCPFRLLRAAGAFKREITRCIRLKSDANSAARRSEEDVNKLGEAVILSDGEGSLYFVFSQISGCFTAFSMTYSIFPHCRSVFYLPFIFPIGSSLTFTPSKFMESVRLIDGSINMGVVFLRVVAHGIDCDV